jgi:Kdo2-lipid IVA lauroyltransferase/acyltransferase
LGRRNRDPGRREPKRVRHALQYLLLRAVLLILSALSWEGIRILGRALGLFAFEILRVRRRVTLENLSHAFPDWSPQRRTCVARECYRNFGITFLELCRLPTLGPGELMSRVVFEEFDVFADARKEGHGAVLLTGHLGNWELPGASLPGHGFPTWAVVGPQRNRRVDAYVNRARAAAGLRVLPSDGGLRPILRALRANEFVAFLSDQDAGRDGVFVPFMGRLASTPLGPVRFARLAGCPIILGYGVRGADGRCHMELPPPIRVRSDLPPEVAELEATRLAVAQLEDVVRRHPEQWFWMHRRWKTRPPARSIETETRGVGA